ncbi:hypothetical protein AN218_06400 [Streptomyces nanshensis]|uniref:DUF3995 domain-containing protein n=2 Tax=Streptomyces nanshensis TaxID=518642 RepID=A0A1E7L9D1_9ACTN|nr:hypothetical protein AN218_06400 [Streptomyces nanshensis]
MYVAFAFTLVFMLLHLYWAVGGTWGLPLMETRNRSAVQAANWVVCAVELIGAFFILALNHPVGRRVPAWTLLVPLWIAAVVCLSHGVYGFVTKGLYLSGWHGAVDFPSVPGVSAATAAGRHQLSAIQDLVVFEPCFVLQGALVALAAWQFVRTSARRRIWLTSVIVGTVLIAAFGTLLSLGGMHIAVY